jgi:hypothetical protein
MIFTRCAGRATITAPETGRFQLGIDGNDGYRLYMDDKLLIDNLDQTHPSDKLADFRFEKGRAYNLRIEFYEPVGNAWFRLVWTVGAAEDGKAKASGRPLDWPPAAMWPSWWSASRRASFWIAPTCGFRGGRRNSSNAWRPRARRWWWCW